MAVVQQPFQSSRSYHCVTSSSHQSAKPLFDVSMMPLRPYGLDRGVPAAIHFRPVEVHIHNRAPSHLCVGGFAGLETRIAVLIVRCFFIAGRHRDELQDDDDDQSQKRQPESYLPADL